ncbi:MAG: hypothetical protein WC069_04510 [Candidatus Shapirobacteria bacterium]
MKQKYIELAKKVLDEKTERIERAALEDQLIEMAYQIANGYDIKPEDFDDLMREKRLKNGMLKPVGDIKAWFRQQFDEKSKEKDSIENVGDILEIVETYTARF